MAKYLYNGVELPALPEWDKEKYPYATITDDYYGTDVIKVGYVLSLTDKPLIFTEGDENYPTMHHKVQVNYCRGLNWYYYPEKGELEWNTPLTFTSLHLWDDDKIIWSNHNIYLDNGTIFFAKCDDPVPVSTTDPQSLTAGWLVSKKIVEMRHKESPIFAINPNLAPLSKMSVWNEQTYEQHGFEWIISKNTVNSGLRFEPNGLTAGETYTISYRIQKKSGTLKTIRGHCAEGWTQIKWSIDGVQQSDSYASNVATAIVADDDTPHFVEFTGIYKASGSQNGFFVQPNRMQNVPVTFSVWNFKVELGDTATPWVPAEEDVLV